MRNRIFREVKIVFLKLKQIIQQKIKIINLFKNKNKQSSLKPFSKAYYNKINKSRILKKTNYKIKMKNKTKTQRKTKIIFFKKM